MAARKLQKEIEQTLKRVAEGLDLFDDIREKVEETEPGQLRDKFESELKREIKKLQRMRDSIRSWIGNKDIMDKDTLIGRRKDIEERMEIFKDLERQSKMKTYSKEGLAKMRKKKKPEVEEPPEKTECKEWIDECIQTINEQLEEMEESLHELQQARKPDRDETHALEERIERHRLYLERLEEMLELLDDDIIAVEDVNEIKESVTYFVDENDDPDFVDDEYWFDGIEEKKEQAEEQADESEEEDIPDPEEIKKEVLKKIKKHQNTKKGKGKVADAVSIQAPKPSDVFSTLVNHNVPTKSKKEKGTTRQQASDSKKEKKTQQSATAAAATQPKQPAGAKKSPSPAPIAPRAVTPPVGASPMPISFSEMVKQQTTKQSQTPPPDSQARQSVPQQPQVQILPSPFHQNQQLQQQQQQQQQQLHQRQSQLQQRHPAVEQGLLGGPGQSGMIENQLASQVAGLSISGMQGQQQRQHTTPLPPQPMVPQQQQQQQQHIAWLQQQQQRQPSPAPPSLAQQQQQPSSSQYQLFPSLPLPFDLDLFKLDQSYLKLPQTTEVESPSRYTPINPCIPPEAFPRQIPSVFNNPAIYAKMDLDTLFYIFYYQQGTIQQYYAAKRLKELSWRYHKKYLTWFQRHEEPTRITSNYEEGTYVYFDYEDGWCKRIKQGFKFEYAWLE